MTVKRQTQVLLEHRMKQFPILTYTAASPYLLTYTNPTYIPSPLPNAPLCTPTQTYDARPIGRVGESAGVDVYISKYSSAVLLRGCEPGRPSSAAPYHRKPNINISTMLHEFLSHPVVVIVALLTIYVLTSSPRRRRPNIPIIGTRKGDWFPHLQAQWRNTRDFEAALAAAYAQARPVLVPVLGEGDIVIMPPADIKFLLDQPDSVLGFSERAFEGFQIDYTFPDPTIPRIPLHETLLRTKLTPQIGSLVPDMADETACAFDAYWKDTEMSGDWREVCVFESMRHIVGRVANRAFIGLPFCRDPELVNNGMAFAADIPLSSTIIKLIWKPLRPILAPIVTIPNRLHTRRFRKIIIAETERRLRIHEAGGPEPNDFLQWSIQQAKATGNPYMWRSAVLADRILIVNFAAIHTTSLTLTEAILDLVSSQPEHLDAIREEIASVFALHNGQWSKPALSHLHKLDSAIRESARLNSIVTIGLGRTVVADAGLTTAGPGGAHLPKGTKVSVAACRIMRDEARYAGGAAFLPFRFSDRRAAQGADHVRLARNALPTTNPDFLTFGHGRHACPGRFFAAAEMKLVLAHAILRYDFAMLPERPAGSWFGVVRRPPLTATVRIRKRGEGGRSV